MEGAINFSISTRHLNYLSSLDIEISLALARYCRSEGGPKNLGGERRAVSSEYKTPNASYRSNSAMSPNTFNCTAEP